ncbi:MAG: hypothetical protein LBL33_10290 [Tannerella sp.]|jgi:hypothetical protein|nr:hypothetical protein [Tannerella sp.]
MRQFFSDESIFYFYLIKNEGIYLFRIACPLSPCWLHKRGNPETVRKKRHNIRIGFEAIVTGYFTNVAKPAHLRELRSDFDTDLCVLLNESNLSLMSTAFGIKPEIFPGRNRWGISTGLRLSRYEMTFRPHNGPFYRMLGQE